MAVSGAPSVEHELSLSHRGYVTFAFALPLAAAAGFEAVVALKSDVWRRDRLLVLAQAMLAVALLAAAVATSPWALTGALAVAGAASGIACGAAQALVLAADEGGADRAMVRWALFSAFGDVAAPLLTAAAIALGHSYRWAMGLVGVSVLAQCAASARLLRRTPAELRAADPGVPEPSPAPLRTAVARAMRLPRLWLWLLTAATCTLLDELVIALASLRLAREGGMSAALAAATAAAFACGSVLGAALTERALSYTTSRRLLIASGLVSALALPGLLASSRQLPSCLALFVLALASAPHHPLSMARAYGQLPDQPGTVQALSQLFVVADVVVPVALGLVADRFGLGAALGCLILQPAVVTLVATFVR